MTQLIEGPQSGVRIALPNVPNRWTSLQDFANVARAYEASGVVDQTLTWDQIVFFWPPKLWTDENSGMKGVLGDLDSFCDVFASGAYGLAAAPNLGLVVCTDAIRRGPAELFQTMTTLAKMSQGEIIIQMGAGELKQCQPYGWKRSRGLKRLEDQLRLSHLIYDSDKPVSHEGNDWTFDEAWLGAARPERRPQIWGVGGGPKLLDLSTSYADGFCTCSPYVWANPDETAEGVSGLKADLERKDRDPETFGLGSQMFTLIHDDPNVIDQMLENPLLKWVAAAVGRINQAAWDREGVEPAFPRDWHYAMKMLPIRYSDAEVDEILGKVTREMTEKSLVFGSVEEVSDELQRHVDAGLNWLSLFDYTPFLATPEEGAEALKRSLDVCSILKNKVASPAAAPLA